MDNLSEEDMAAAVVEYLRSLLWDVHQEVELGYASARADIVAVQGPVLWIIEVKTTMSLALLEQVQAWQELGAANIISCATPPSYRRNAGRVAADKFLRMHGIGWMEVKRPDGWNPKPCITESWNWPIRPVLPPRMQPAARRSRYRGILLGRLCEETRTYAKAGNADGKRWTPFQATCQALRETIRQAGRPLTIREIVAQLGREHHYANDASARSTLPRWIEAGKVPGVVVVEGRPRRFALA